MACRQRAWARRARAQAELRAAAWEKDAPGVHRMQVLVGLSCCRGSRLEQQADLAVRSARAASRAGLRARPCLRRQKLAVQRQPDAAHQGEAVAEQLHCGSVSGQVEALRVSPVKRAKVHQRGLCQRCRRSSIAVRAGHLWRGHRLLRCCQLPLRGGQALQKESWRDQHGCAGHGQDLPASVALSACTTRQQPSTRCPTLESCGKGTRGRRCDGKGLSPFAQRLAPHPPPLAGALQGRLSSKEFTPLLRC